MCTVIFCLLLFPEFSNKRTYQPEIHVGLSIGLFVLVIKGWIKRILENPTFSGQVPSLPSFIFKLTYYLSKLIYKCYNFLIVSVFFHKISVSNDALVVVIFGSVPLCLLLLFCPQTVWRPAERRKKERKKEEQKRDEQEKKLDSKNVCERN